MSSSNSTRGGNSKEHGDGDEVSGNKAAGVTTGGTGQGNGGGLDFYSGGNLLIVNSTFFGNQAISQAGEGFGGGMFITLLGSHYAYLVNDTVVDNSATNSQGGISAAPFLVMENTIVAGNMDTANSVPDDMDNVNLYSAGNNLIGITGTGFAFISPQHNLTFSSTGVPSASSSGYDPTDLTNIDPQLGSLGNNGGPTQTLVPKPGSPAIDAGGNTFAVPTVIAQVPTTDQRGSPRPINSTTDIGAVEYQYDLALTGSETLASSTLTYSLQAANNGPDPAGSVTLADVLPSGLTFVSASGPSGWTASNPAIGSSGTVSFTLNSGSFLSDNRPRSPLSRSSLPCRPLATRLRWVPLHGTAIGATTS